MRSHVTVSPSNVSATIYDFLVSFATGRFIWEFALGQDGKIEGLTLSPYAPPAQHLNESALIAAVRAKLHKDSKTGSFSGAVLVAKHGAPIF